MVTATNFAHVRRANQVFYRVVLASLSRWRSPARRQELKRLADKIGKIVSDALEQ